MSLLPHDAAPSTADGNAEAAQVMVLSPELADNAIWIRGARVHNLRNVSLAIPRDRVVVITGPSGSGKSSLAMDTLCAEGQRQYIESLSAYARQFLHQMERADVDLIEGLQPTVAIDQRSGSPNPRSTVATVTEIYDHLRLMYARLGEACCYGCGEPIRPQSPEQIQQSLLSLPEGTKAMLLAPLVRGRKGGHKDVLAAIRKHGFVRARVDGQVFDIDSLPELEPRKNHTIEAVVDRIVVRDGVSGRAAESIALALQHGDGAMIVCFQQRGDNGKGGNGKSQKSGGSDWTDQLFSTSYSCPNCKISFEELEPRSFSFNSPYGACPECDGLGVRPQFDPDLFLADRQLSLAAGAIVPWKGLTAAGEKRLKKHLELFFEKEKFDWQTPLANLTDAAWERFLQGSGGNGKGFMGVYNILEREYSTTTRTRRKQKLEAFRGEVLCAACQGSRLRPEARSVLIADRSIDQVAAMTVTEAASFFASLEFHQDDLPIAEPLLREIENRLRFLDKVGVQYLTLDRPADTLSGGELQRVRLATGIGSGLVGVCYVLDEPSIGLHPRDNGRLIDALRELQAQGNTVLIVEHDEAMMRAADHLIDVGPGAGRHGGQIVAAGTPQQVMADPASITGQYLSGARSIPVPMTRRRTAKSRSITIGGASTNNLKNIDVRIPLGVLVCMTGVSGSGKSSLVNETLVRAITRRLGLLAPKPGEHDSLRGVSQIDKLIAIDQSPIGRTPRSNPATYCGVFDEIRKVFSGTRQSKQRGYGVGRFSFNVKGGRCEACQGQGQQKIEMNFLPDLHVTCPECNGARFNRQTLQVTYKGLSIADVLELPIEEAVTFFENFSAIQRTLQCMVDVGLGYLTLGLASTKLSGGEAQRIKLATELARADTGSTLYVLDEPTTGLHFDDIRKLLDVLHRLVDAGNTVLVIEHNLDVVKCADWLIDLGPEGGAAGGEVVATGTPEEIAALEGNHTGRFLRELLN